MPGQRQPRRRAAANIKPHPLVEALVPDPSQPPVKATRLFGYPGAGTDDGTTRLYQDLDLTSFVDIPNDAILHSQTLENDAGTLVWVDPSATVRHSTVQSHEVQADFLSGGIQEAHLAAAAGMEGIRAAPGLMPTPTLHTMCFICQPTIGTPCPPSLGIACTYAPPCHVVSYAVPCATRACPSLQAPCVSIGIVCPFPTREPRCRSVGFRCNSFPGCASGIRCMNSIPCETADCGGPLGGPIDPVG